MDLLADPQFKNKYQKHKLRVKLWESDFMENHGRKPNKNDIKEADISIRESYKMYWQLKTRALEETLMDITFTDDIQSNVSNKSPKKASAKEAPEEKKQSSENFEKDAENIDPHCHSSQETNTSVLQETNCSNVKGVWGDHLSRSNGRSPKKKRNMSLSRSSSFQLSQNKFASSSFTKRNPRKSLSISRIKVKSEDSISTTSSALEQTDIDCKDGFDVPEEPKHIFGEVKVIYTESKPVTHSISTVQQLIKGHTINRDLNAGWLDRCAKQNNIDYPSYNAQRLSGTSDSGLESMESSIRSPMEEVPSQKPSSYPQISDEEDFVCNSDSEEEERKNKRIRNFKKRLSDEINQVTKRLRLSDSVNDSGCQPPLENAVVSHQNSALVVPTVIGNIEKCDEKSNSDVNSKSCVTTVTKQADVTKETIPNEINTSNAISSKQAEAEQVNTADQKETSKDVLSKEPVQKRRIRRRIKQPASDDSEDPDFENEEVKTNRRKSTKGRTVKSTTTTGTKKKSTTKSDESKPRRPQRRKKNIVNIDDEENVEIGTRTKGTRPIAVKGTNIKIAGAASTNKSKRKQKATTNIEDDAEDEAESNETTTKGPNAIYGIETLQTVPRFALHANKINDLVEQFSETVSKSSSTTIDSIASGKSKKPLNDKEKLEKKIAQGKVNENFVRINLKKKVFVRGKKNFNFSKYKKNQWKNKKKDLASGEGGLDVADLIEKNGGVLSCFKCGETGHFSRYCPKQKGDDLIPLEDVDESTGFPTLEEAEKMAEQSAISAHASRINRLPEKPSYSSKLEEESEETSPNEQANDNEDLWEPIDEEELLRGHEIPKELVSKLLPPEKGTVQPLYNSDQDTPLEVFDALLKFGHKSFKPGQEKAVMRVLSGQSTLVTLSTGAGKSLCYQLPAYLYSKHSKCITLVISPLVSLMDDQVTGIPAFLSAACLHTAQPPKVRENIIEMVKTGQISVLLVSPEAVVAGEKSTGFGALLRELPPIAFACIDEAHCISQWSHNFRPSYLMVCRVLREKLGVSTILALTATATKSNAESIVKYLNIHDGMAGVISDIPMPKNLTLTISKDTYRDQALVALLRSQRFAECNSIIVYCTRRDECARIAGLLRVNLQDMHEPEKPNVKVSAIAESYHAGLSAHRRKIVQKAFMGGQIRVIVATIAFGMGLNKSDIRAVIHYNMPATFEGYVQEVGRAGRDGLPAHCHLFLSATADSDKWELQRHIHADGVDRHTIRRLLQKVFVPCSCSKLREKNDNRRCPGHEVAIPIDETVLALDITEEMISTLLCYLELHPKKFITVLSSVYAKAKVSSYSGPKGLKLAAQNSPPLAMAIALDSQKGVLHENSNIIEFPVVDVASAIGWDSGVVKSHLKNLEWKTVDGKFKRSAITVRYDTLALRMKAPGDLTEDELDEALDALYARALSQQNSALQQLETISNAVHKFSTPKVQDCLQLTDELLRKSEDLKNVIRDYFQSEPQSYFLEPKSSQETLSNEAQVANDVRSLILSYRDNSFTGRAVARIFHGIQSPNYPAYVWGKCRFWRLHLSTDFTALCQIATREILALR